MVVTCFILLLEYHIKVRKYCIDIYMMIFGMSTLFIYENYMYMMYMCMYACIYH